MANTREIKTRLRGVRKTQQITRAMKMVATVKLRHAQMALAASRPFAERMLSIASDILAQIDRSQCENPFFAQRPVKNMLLIVVASDQGLCGSMNITIFHHVLHFIDNLAGTAQNAKKPDVNLLLIGRKAKAFFKAQQNAQTEGAPYRVMEAIPFAGLDSADLGSRCCEFYRKGVFDRIDLCYNESFSALQHRAVSTALFPLDFEPIRKEHKDDGGSTANTLFEPDCDAMADDVVRGYIVSKVREIMLGADVAEQAARMLMMDLATKNADDLIAGMQLTMNKLRQLAITNELADITTGAEAVA